MAEDKKLYRVSTPSTGYDKIWDEERLNRNYDALMQKYPDTKVENATPNGKYKVKVNVEGTDYEQEWDEGRYNANFNDLKAKYANAEAAPMYDYTPYERVKKDNAVTDNKQQVPTTAPEQPAAPAAPEGPTTPASQGSQVPPAASEQPASATPSTNPATGMRNMPFSDKSPIPPAESSQPKEDKSAEYGSLMSAMNQMNKLQQELSALDENYKDKEYGMSKKEWKEKRRVLKDRIDKVQEVIDNKPAYKESLATMSGEIDSSKKSIEETYRTQFDETQNAYNTEMESKRENRERISGSDEARYRNMFGSLRSQRGAAMRMLDEAQDILNSPLRYADGKQFSAKNVWKGIKDVVTDANFWTVGLLDVSDNMEVISVLKKLQDKNIDLTSIENGETPLDKDGKPVLTGLQQSVIDSYLTLQSARLIRAADMAGGYKAGTISAESLDMIVGMILGGELASVATKPLKKFLTKQLAKQLSKMTSKAGRFLMKEGVGAAEKLAVDVVGSAIGSTVTPLSAEAITNRVLEVGEDGKLNLSGKAVGQGWLDGFFEYFTEQIGDIFPRAFKDALKVSGINSVSKFIAQTTKLGNKGIVDYFERMGRRGLNAPAVFVQGHFNGLWEVGEEAVNAAIDKMRGNVGAWEDFTNWENLLSMVEGFGLTTVIGASTSAANVANNRSELIKRQNNIKALLGGLTINGQQLGETELNQLAAVFEGNTIVDEQGNIIDDVDVEGLKKRMAYIIAKADDTELAQKIADATGLEIDPKDAKKVIFDELSNYLLEASKFKASVAFLNGKKYAAVEKWRNEELKKTGGKQFWFNWQGQDKDGKPSESQFVEIATLNDGTRCFVVTNYENGVPVLTADGKFTAMTLDGSKILFIDRDDIMQKSNGEPETYFSNISYYLANNNWEDKENRELVRDLVDFGAWQRANINQEYSEQPPVGIATQTYEPGDEVVVLDEAGNEVPGTVLSVADDGASVEVDIPGVGVREVGTGQVAPKAAPEATTEEVTPEEVPAQQPADGVQAEGQPVSEPTPEQTVTEAPQEGTAPAEQEDTRPLSQLLDEDPMAFYTKYSEIDSPEGAVEEINSRIEQLKKEKSKAKLDDKPAIVAKIKALNSALEQIKSQLSENIGQLEAPAQPATTIKSEERRAEAQKRIEAAKAGREKAKARWDNLPKVKGNNTAIVDADGNVVEGHWELVEADALTASHDPLNGFEVSEGATLDSNGRTLNDRDYKNTPSYQKAVTDMAADYDGRAWVSNIVVNPDTGEVVSGNNRVMSAKLAYKNGTATKYREHGKKYAADKGFKPEDFDSMQAPVAVFVPDTALPMTTETFARFNKRTEKSQNNTEAAVKYGKLVNEDDIRALADIINQYDDINAALNSEEAVDQIITTLVKSGVISEADVHALKDGKKLSGTGRDLVEAVLIGAVLEEEPLRIASADADMRRAIISAMSQILEFKKYKDYDLSNELNDAILLLDQAKRNGIKVGESVQSYMRQLELFEGAEDKVYEASIQLLADIINKKAYTTFKKVLSSYNRDAKEYSEGNVNMFEDSDKETLLRTIIKAVLGYDIRTIDEKEVSSAKSAEAIANESGGEGEGAGAQEEEAGAAVRSEQGGAGEGVTKKEQEEAEQPTSEERIEVEGEPESEEEAQAEPEKKEPAGEAKKQEPKEEPENTAAEDANQELTEDEVRNSGYPDADVVESAIDYINGDRGFGATTSYIIIKDYVRNRPRNNGENSADANGTQLAPSDANSGRVAGNESAVKSGELAGQDSGQNLSGQQTEGIGEQPRDVGGIKVPAEHPGEQGNMEVPGGKTGDAGSNTADRNTGGRGGDGQHGTQRVSQGRGTGTNSENTSNGSGRGPSDDGGRAAGGSVRGVEATQKQTPAGISSEGLSQEELDRGLMDALSEFSEGLGDTKFYSVEPALPALVEENPQGYSTTPKPVATTNTTGRTKEQRDSDELSKGRPVTTPTAIPVEKLGVKQISALNKIFFFLIGNGVKLINDGYWQKSDFAREIKRKYGEMLKNSMHINDAQVLYLIDEAWNQKKLINGQKTSLNELTEQKYIEEIRSHNDIPFEELQKKQKDAPKVGIKAADMKDIAEQLPILQIGQREDIAKIERQFFSDEHNDYDHAYGKGMLITNGTGTGKTYTGLGTIRRFLNSGKDRILLVVPAGKVLGEWINTARNSFGIEIKQLEDRKDKGKGVAITTIENIRDNQKIFEDTFDLVIYDECQKIIMSQEGGDTQAYETHQLITNKNAEYAALRLAYTTPEGKELIEAKKRVEEINKELAGKKTSAKDPIKLNIEKSDLNERIRVLESEVNLIKLGLLDKGKEEAKKTKVLFLSATPFASVKTLKIAAGYAFNYPRIIRSDGTENTKEESLEANFRTTWFSTSNPEEGEVNFGDHLLHDLETMQYRELDNGYDYSRDFPSVSGMVMAARFNAAWSYIMGNATALQHAAFLTNPNWNSLLFEVMKCAASFERMEEHLAAGRKLVIYHARKKETEWSEENKQKMPPIGPPFATFIAQLQQSKDPNATAVMIDFVSKFKDVLAWEQTLDYRPVQEQVLEHFATDAEKAVYQEEMGKYNEEYAKFERRMEALMVADPNLSAEKARQKAKPPKEPQLKSALVSVYNGDRKDNLDEFNADKSSKRILCITSQAGNAGINLHDRTGKHQRVIMSLYLPHIPIHFIQIEGRTYRIGNKSNAIYEYPLLGFDLESSTFGYNINKKAETVENLAHGSAGRGLRASILKQFIENSGNVPIAGQGVGGKEMDRRGSALKGIEAAKHDYEVMRRNGTETKSNSIQETIGYVLSKLCGSIDGDDVLVPSAGRGSASRYLPTGVRIKMFERRPALVAMLNLVSMRDGNKVDEDGSLEDLSLNVKYDSILIGGESEASGFDAAEQLSTAFYHLSEGGRVVAIVPDNESTEDTINPTLSTHQDIIKRLEIKLGSGVAKNIEGPSKIVVYDKITNPKLRSGVRTIERDITQASYEDAINILDGISVPERIIDKKAINLKKVKSLVSEFNKNGIAELSVNGERVRIEIKRAKSGLAHSGIDFDSVYHMFSKGERYLGKWFNIDMDSALNLNPNHTLVRTYNVLNQALELDDEEIRKKFRIGKDVSDELFEKVKELFRLYQRFVRAITGLNDSQLNRVAQGLSAEISSAEIGDTLDAVTLKEKFDAANKGDEERAERFEGVYRIMKDSGISIDSANDAGGTAAVYRPRLHSISFNKAAWNRMSDDERAETVLHEMIHSVTCYALNAYDYTSNVPEELDYFSELATKVYNALQLGDPEEVRKLSGRNSYILENVEEMLANTTKTKVREILKDRPLWIKEVDGRIARVFGREAEGARKVSAWDMMNVILDGMLKNFNQKMLEQYVLSNGGMIQHSLDGLPALLAVDTQQRESSELFSEDKSVKPGELDATTRDAMVKRADELSTKLGLDMVVHTSKESITGSNSVNTARKKRAYGWFDTNTGKIHLVLPNIKDVEMLEAVVLHEGAGHYGLRELFGKDFERAMLNIYNSVDSETRNKIDAYVNDGYSADKASAVEEYASVLYSRGPMNDTEYSVWRKIRKFIVDALRKLGFKMRITDEDIRAIVHTSYLNLASDATRKVRSNLQIAEDNLTNRRLKQAAIDSHDKSKKKGGGNNGSNSGGAEDAEYMKAVERGDMEAAKKMVEAKAQALLNAQLLPDDEEQIGYKYHRGPAPKKIKKMYAVFNVSPDGFRAAYAGNNSATPVGVWLDAQNLRSYPSQTTFFDDGTPATYIPGDTGKSTKAAGIDPASRGEEAIGKSWLLERGGKHGSDVANFSQMNLRVNEEGEKVNSSTEGALPHNKLVFEVEVGMSEDGDLTEYVKQHGRKMKGKNQGLQTIGPNQFYFFKTNPNAKGNWGIAGTFRIKRLVPYEEIVASNDKAGLPVQKWVGGYHPEDFGLSVEAVDKMYQEGKKQKLPDAVTYDDMGNVIPLSQRFSEEDDLRYADSEYDGTTFRDDNPEIEKMTKAANSWVNAYIESNFDEFKSVKEMQKVIEERIGRKLTGAENVAFVMNQLRSAFDRERNKFKEDYILPLQKAIRSVINSEYKKDDGKSATRDEMYDLLTQYMSLKNGLERQTIFAKRDALEALDTKMKKALENENRVFEAIEKKFKLKKAHTAEEQAQFEKQKKAHDEEIEKIYDYYTREIERVNMGDETQSDYAKFRKNDYGAIRTWFGQYKDEDGKLLDTMPEQMPGESREHYNERLRLMFVPRDAEMEDAEKRASDWVKDFEKQIGASVIDRLWSETRRSTDYNIDLMFKHGVISKDVRERLIGKDRMFKNYIPMMGFAEDTESDIYASMNGSYKGSVYEKPLVRAKGRISKPESPFAHILAMHDSASYQSFNNDGFMALYKLATNTAGKQNYVKVQDAWFVKIPGTDVFVETYPDIDYSANADVQNEQLNDFNLKMQMLKANGEAYKTKREVNLHGGVVRMLDKDKTKHIVKGKLLGRDISVIFNGDPRPAMAINNLLRDNNNVSNVLSKMVRWLSKSSTSYRPSFVLGTNLQRDLIDGILNSYTNKEDMLRYLKNLTKSFVVIPWLNTFDGKAPVKNLRNPKLWKSFNEFMDAGGATGWGYIERHDEWERYVDREVKQSYIVDNEFVGAVKSLGATLMRFMESFELVSRFAAYLTAKENGEDKVNAIAKAKEVTLNFNQKGTYHFFTWDETANYENRKGQKLGDDNGFWQNKLDWATRVLLASSTMFSNKLHSYIPFFGAIQAGIYKFMRNIKDNPARAGVVNTLMFAAGVMPYLLFGDALAGDDDDDNKAIIKDPEMRERIRKYANLSDYQRRKKFTSLPIGSNEFGINWATPQEWGLAYTAGEAAGRIISHFDTVEDAVGDVAKEVSNTLLPFSWNNLRHNLYGVSLGLDLLLNEDFRGNSISRKNEWNKYDPQFTYATNYTWNFLTDISEWLNGVTGGSYITRGKFSFDPTYVQHTIRYFGGGAIDEITTVTDLITSLGDETNDDKSLMDMPLVKGYSFEYDKKWTSGHLKEQYNEFISKAEKIKHDVKKAKEKDGLTVEERVELLDKIESSKDYFYYWSYFEKGGDMSYSKRLKDNWSLINMAQEDGERKSYIRELYQERDQIRQEWLDECMRHYYGKD